MNEGTGSIQLSPWFDQRIKCVSTTDLQISYAYGANGNNLILALVQAGQLGVKNHKFTVPDRKVFVGGNADEIICNDRGMRWFFR